MKDGKSIGGAYNEMRRWAEKRKVGQSACVGPMDAGEIILKYYGCEDPQAMLEGGMMYALLMARAEKLKPYGVEPKIPIEPPKPQAPAKTGSLSLGLDDLLGL